MKKFIERRPGHGHRGSHRLLAAGFATVLVLSMGTNAASADPTPSSKPAPGPILNQQAIFTGHPDRCFNTIGGVNPLLSAGMPTCPDPNSILNTRQSYAWGGARVGDF